jgi:hypothetical protein
VPAIEPVVIATSDLTYFTDESSNAYTATSEVSEHFESARIGDGEKRKTNGGLLP